MPNGGVQLTAVRPVDVKRKPENGASNGTKPVVIKEKKSRKEMVGCCQLFRYVKAVDVCLMLFGSLAAMAQGSSLPLMMLLFGEILTIFIRNDILETVFDPSILASMNLTINDVRNNVTIRQIVAARMNLTADYVENQIKQATTEHIYDALTDVTIYYVYIGIATILCGYISNAFWIMVARRQTKLIRENFLRAILRQDMAWFDTHEPGELTTRLSEDMHKIEEGIGDKLGTFVQLISTFIVAFVIAFTRSWKLSLVLACGFPLLTFSAFFNNKILPIFTRKEQAAYASAGSIAEQAISSIRTVVAFGGEAKECSRFNENLSVAKKYAERKASFQGLLMGCVWLILYCTYGLAFWYGSKLVREEPDFDAGKLLTIFFNCMIGSFSLGNAFPNLEYTHVARGAAYFIFSIIDRIPEIDPSSDEGKKPDKFRGDIRLKNVYFNYPARPDVKVLQGLSLEVSVGQTAALVGASGCGKSTVIQLLQRLYDPLGGSVEIDGIDLREYNVRYLRNQIGLVSQEPCLFALTIEENIRYGRDGVTKEQIQRACDMANASEFINKLPQGYDTLVGDRGAQLSGGQKQRIAIARALVRDPKILLLDEATSALDTESESLVQEALDKARQGRTTLVVAHRLSTIKNADVIFGLIDGVVAETGSHDDLMQQNGLYNTLVTNQTVDEPVHEETSSEESDDDEVKDQHIKSPVVLETERQDSRISRTSRQDSRISRTSRQDSVTSELSVTVSRKKGKKNRKNKRAKKTKDGIDILEPSMRDLLALNSSEWHFILLGSLGALIAGSIHPCYSVIMTEILDAFTLTDLNEQERVINFLSGMLVMLGGVAFISLFFQFYMFGKSGEALTKRVRQMTFKSILRQEISWFDDPHNSTGALATRLSQEATYVQGATGSRIGMMMSVIGTMGTGLIIAFVYGWQLTLVILVFVPLMIIGGYIQMKFLHGAGRNKGSGNPYEQAGQISSEAISNIRTVKALTKEDEIFKRYLTVLDPLVRTQMKYAHVVGLAFGVSQSIILFAMAAAFTYGGYLVQEGVLEFHLVFRILAVTIIGAANLGRTISMYPDFGRARKAATTVWTLINHVPRIDSQSEDGLKPEEVKGDIEFTRCRFSYPLRKNINVLQNLSLKVPSGERIALVGGSGCGKSTTVQLIERFYDPKRGSITLDGNELKDVNVTWLRSQLGIVSQEPVLFAGSIKQNIEYGDNSRQVAISEVIDVAKQANIHDFISSLPQGYDTLVGDRGTQLSGGQKQRIAIARALIRNPRILLLDEATSALDTESEKVVQDALDRAQLGRTCVVIAHRLSTIQTADRIVVLHNGQVVEQGTHSELISLEGRYFQLVKKGQKH